MAAILLSNVYNHYLSSYISPNSSSSRSDFHKRSELKDLYTSIVWKNAESPLLLLKQDDRSTEMNAVALKESSRQLSDSLNLFNSYDDSDGSKRTAYSTDDSAVSAEYIGTGSDPDSVQDATVHVDALAQNQINTGSYLPDSSINLEAGSYYFDAQIANRTYEFQFNIADGDTNSDIQNKIARLVNKSGINIKASVSTNENGESALILSSDFTGVSDQQDKQFNIYDSLSSPNHGVVPYLGINSVSQYPSNSEYTLNGVHETSQSNTVYADNNFKLTFNNISNDDEAVTIGVSNDNSSFIDSVSTMANGYNKFIDAISGNSNPSFKNDKVMAKVMSIANKYKSSMESLGVNMDNSGHIQLDDQLLSQDDDLDKINISDKFQTVKDFTSELSDKVSDFILDPVKYAYKPIVNYKNPGHTFPNPYVTSRYSGMMFSSYC